jgi:hypothetical protein
MGSNGAISFLEKIKTIVENEFYKNQYTIDKKYSTPAFSDYSYSYIIFGFLGLIKQWFDNDASTPSKEMALILTKIALNRI